MTKRVFGMCAILALALTGSQTILSAEDGQRLEGVWDISVTVKNCQTGAVIRTVRSLQMFSHDGSFTETANTFLRGSSLGTWTRTGEQTFDAEYWFFRYKPDGTFASIAKALDAVTLSGDGNEFTASGSIEDFDANNNPISTGCFTHAAKRLSAMKKDD